MSTLSRAEEILLSKIMGSAYDKPAQSRLEELLLQLNTGTGVDTTELTRELYLLKDNVSTLEQVMSDNTEDLTALRSDVETNENTIQTIGSSVETAQNDIGSIRRDVSELSTTMQETKIDIDDLQLMSAHSENRIDTNVEDIKDINRKISVIQDDLEQVEWHVREHHTTLDSLEDSNGEQVLDDLGAVVQAATLDWGETTPVNA